MSRHSEILNSSRHIFDLSPTNILRCSFLWLKSTDLDEIFSLAPKSARWLIGVARYTARKISPTPKLTARRRGIPTAPRACSAPTQGHARIVVEYPIECDHIYVNRVISHEVIVSECITLQTLHRRFRPGTACVGLILKTYSLQNLYVFQ